MTKIDTTRKIFILDTNVLLHDADSLISFEDNHIVLILQVLEELDTFKSKPGELGASARKAAHYLDKARKLGKINEQVPIGNKGGTISVIDAPKEADFPKSLKDSVDNDLLETTYSLGKIYPNVTLVTKDINLRIKADVLNIKAEDYTTDKKNNIYDGHSEIVLNNEQIEDLKFTTRLTLPEQKLNVNEYLLISHEDDEHELLLARAVSETKIKLVEWTNSPIIGIKPRNIEQHFLMDALLDESIKLVTIHGKAGTGKTLLSIAAALYKTYVDHAYVKIKLMRPVIPVDKGIGFLPGSLEEKMEPWMAPIYNNLEFLKQEDRKTGRTVLPITFDESDIIEVAPLSYIRGQSVANSIMIIDEAQNLTPLDIKTIVTRAGEKTKLIFTGDIDQIDHPYLSMLDNGLTYLASRFRGNKLHSHITLIQGERSELAEIASNIL